MPMRVPPCCLLTTCCGTCGDRALSSKIVYFVVAGNAVSDSHEVRARIVGGAAQRALRGGAPATRTVPALMIASARCE